MNLNTFGSYFNRVILPLLLIVGSLVFIVVGVFNVLGFLEKSRLGQTKLPNNLTFDSVSQAVRGGQYQFSDPKLDQNLPNQVSTYKASFGLVGSDLEALTKRLGITTTPVKKNHLTTYTQGAAILTYDSSLNLITYNKVQDVKSSNRGFGEDDVNIAKSFLEGLIPNEVKFTGVTYTTGSTHSANVSPKDAQLAIYHFQPLVDKKVVAEDNLVVLANNKELINFQIHPFKVIGKESTYIAKNKKDVEDDIAIGQFFLRYKQETADMAGQNIASATFNNLDLGYVTQPKQNLIQPAYLLSGTASFKNSNVDVIGVLSAISGVGVNK